MDNYFMTQSDNNASNKHYGTVIGYTDTAAVLLSRGQIYFLPAEDPTVLEIGTSEPIDGLEPVMTSEEWEGDE